MTVDLESLRAALNVMDEAVCEAYRAMPTPFKLRGESTRHLDQHIAYMSELREAWRTVDAALTELTARRARDAEVEALVAAATPFVALLQAHNEFDHKRNPVSGHQPVFGINDVTIRIGDLRLLRAALLPFLSGDKP